MGVATIERWERAHPHQRPRKQTCYLLTYLLRSPLCSPPGT